MKVKANRNLNDNSKTIIKLQALVRGYLQKRKYKVQQMVVDLKTKYFKLEESRETLSPQQFNENLPTVVKKYTYKSGAVYNG